MSYLVVYLVLQCFAAVLSQTLPSLEYPIVQYCYSKTISGKRDKDCELTHISNSVFKFGEHSKNMLNIKLGKSKYVILMCKATHPIRWLAHKPLGSLKYLANFERVNLKQESFEYSQTVSISLGADYSRILRCESYSNDSLAAELFLPTNPIPTIFTRLVSPFFFVNKFFFVDRSRMPYETFIIPCVGPEFYDEHVVRFSKVMKDDSIRDSEKSSKATIKGVWSENLDVDKAVIGGYDYDSRDVYVSYVNTGTTYLPEDCFMFSGTTRIVNNFGPCKYLLSNSLNSYAWTTERYGAPKVGAVKKPFITKNSEYICRGLTNDTSRAILLPGYLSSNSYCNISSDGTLRTQYELLIDTSVLCNSYCKSRSISSNQYLRSGFDRVYRTSIGLWSDTFNENIALKAGFHPEVGWIYICGYTRTYGIFATGFYLYPSVFDANRFNMPREIVTCKRPYKILTSDSTIIYGWLPRRNGSIADGAIEAGHAASGEITFICRTFIRDDRRRNTFMIPGVFVPSQGTCNMDYLDLKMNTSSYEILVDAGCSCGDYDYDARMGFRQTGQPDFQSKYICYSLSESFYYMYPIRQREEIMTTNLYNGSGVNGEKRIHPEEPFQSLDLEIRVGKCDSVVDCDLKFSPMPPLVGLHGDSVNNDVEVFQRYNKTNGVTSAHLHGYVQCTSQFPYSFESITSEYFRKTDYMFTGLDNEIYFLSKGIPNSSIVKIENEAQRTYTCTISTFVLLPDVYFEITYYEGQGSSKVVHIGDKNPDTLTSDGPANQDMLTRSWRIIAHTIWNVTKISCHARWASSNRWSSAEIVINATSNQMDYGVKESSSLRVNIVIGCCLALVLFLVAIIFILWRKYRNSKKIIRNLTEAEIDEFHNGTKTQDPNNEREAPIENLAFNGCMVIASSDVKIENEVLGKGQYGIVYKGMYKTQLVAVKSCQENADVEYFKAFLKEIKVMAFIGEHKNIVKFHGAVVDNIRNRTCFAVLELCPHGDLNGYLRQYLGSSSNVTADGVENAAQMFEMGSRNDRNSVMRSSVLNSFCMQIANGMEFLSQKKVIHGDMATRNVLVFDHKVVKITDFGLSRKLYNCKSYTKAKQAPLPWRWMALESLQYLQFSTKSDVWSFGVTVWEIFSLAQVPFSGVNWTTGFADQLADGLRLAKPQMAPQHVFELMMRCWENNPDSRPTFKECREFFQHLDYVVI